MTITGSLQKMRATLADTVEYQLSVGEDLIPLNPLLGQPISLAHTGRIFCVHCHRAIKKAFNQGYCYPCFTSLAQCDLCIVKPETCHYHLGTCREPDWALQFCFQPHVVYLANSSGLKVGITRQSQLPTRWLDQGAVDALPVFTTFSRQLAGFVEVEFAQYIGDKTHWQKMLKSKAEPIDLAQKRDELIELCAQGLSALQNRFGAEALMPYQANPIKVNYPIESYPVKIRPFNFDKETQVNGILQGIKGQYLLLDTGVINIRKFSGYEIIFSTESKEHAVLKA
jgi:hypothetical protein